MTQSRSRRKSQSASRPEQPASRPQRESSRSPKDNRSRAWKELRNSNDADVTCSTLTSLIEQDAPLQSHSGLVLMYGPFQAEMVPEHGQGVASWLRECVRKHGLPSLVRYDYRHRAQVFRRDQFQPWLEPLLTKIPG